MTDNQKLNQLVHYICSETKGDPSTLGAVKLNKIIWFSEVFAFIECGKSITDEQFIKLQYGPVPKNILSSLSSLEDDGLLAIRSEHFHGYRQKQYISLDDPDKSFLSKKEKVIVDDVINLICNNHTATSISDLTHNDLWNMAAEGEEIPLAAIFSMTPGAVIEDDELWAKSMLVA
jgi:uncharacterized phage-associated protein